jgi:nicotinamidase-related amidase
MKIVVEDTMAVVIDFQEKLFPHMFDKESLLNNCSTLIQGLKTMYIPTLVTQQYSKGLGETVEDIKLSLGDFEYTEKMSFSCCGEHDFLTKIKMQRKENVILLGIETHVCVLQTALDLIDLGFNPIVIHDCTSSRKLNDKQIAMERLKQEGAMVSTYESILFELCQTAASDEFKTISKLVK